MSMLRFTEPRKSISPLLCICIFQIRFAAFICTSLTLKMKIRWCEDTEYIVNQEMIYFCYSQSVILRGSISNYKSTRYYAKTQYCVYIYNVSL
jgi:hypothetical protein